MCHTPNNGTLEAAVLEQVQEFCDAEQAFSAYDITLALREKVNSGKMEIPEVEDPNHSANFRYNIQHNQVRNAFQALWSDSSLPRLNRSFNGSYFVYSPQTGASQQSVVQQTTPVSATPTPATTPTQLTSVNTSPVNTTDTEVMRRFKVYVANCRTTGKRPTLKEVQSAVKRGSLSTGVSCEQLNNFASKLGFKVVSYSSNLSEAYVE